MVRDVRETGCINLIEVRDVRNPTSRQIRSVWHQMVSSCKKDTRKVRIPYRVALSVWVEI